MAMACLEEACWEYLDPKGTKRGPFPGKTMVQWYDNGLLPEDLVVRHSPNMGFAPIRELFPAPIPPFRTKPGIKKAEPKMPPPFAPALQVGAQCHWYYEDTKGKVQGPFPSNQMLVWYEHKMLPKDLKLRRTTDPSDCFALILDFFPRPLLPFQSQPVSPAITRSGQMQNPQDSTNGSLANKQVGIPPTVAPAVSQPAVAPQAQPQTQTPQQPPKAKAKSAQGGKGKAKQAAGQDDVEGDEGKDGGKDGKDGKGKGGRNGPIGANPGRGKKAQQQQANAAWGWSGPEWAGSDKAWWEWSSWNGWSGGDGDWEGDGNYGRSGKAQGAEWKQDGNGASGTSPGKENKSEKNAAAQQQANGFGLKWGPKSDLADLFPEANQKRVMDEGIIWEERWVSPLAVRFSQGKIHPFFHERGPISEVLLQIQSSADKDGIIRRIEPPFPPMRLLHLKQCGVLVTLDNRRLYALQRFALQEWPQICLVKALCVEELTPTRLKAENRKFTNRIGGLQIEIESRSNAFDTFSWVTEAGRLEHTRFCRPITFKAIDKALSLLPLLVVHLLLCPKMRPYLRSRWPLLQYLAVNLRVPQRREFPAKRLMLHHVLELGKPKRNATICPQVCVGYQLETVVKLSKGKSCLTSNHTISRPLKLVEAPLLISPMQREVLATLLPFFCLPYARTVTCGKTRDWIVGYLLAWGKVSLASMLDVPAP
mmetsp:Transcript_79492/g.125385  ORF Transcript_79492/g.125385 Transcript_79492/m.125385 type:complete len:705 (-) Transcript_79492:98-2212(-)